MKTRRNFLFAAVLATAAAGGVDKSLYKLIAGRHTGPVNLHVEYLGHDDPAIVPKVIEATRRDFEILRGLLG